MSFNDPISDLLTRIRNGQMAHKSSITCPASALRERVLKVMQDEGYIRSFSRKEVRKNVHELTVELKYVDGVAVIQGIERISKPGRRVYKDLASLPKVLNGLGISILSTSKGVISDAEARRANVGGEVLCAMY